MVAHHVELVETSHGERCCISSRTFAFFRAVLPVSRLLIAINLDNTKTAHGFCTQFFVEFEHIACASIESSSFFVIEVRFDCLGFFLELVSFFCLADFEIQEGDPH